MGICVTPPALSSRRKARRLFRKTNVLLRNADISFPEIPFPERDFIIRPDFFGKKYARFTETGMAAVRQLRETESIDLEGTYSGKTLAALIHDIETGERQEETLLFWHTANTFDLTPKTADTDWKTLPPGLHRYFQKAVQPLDRD
jgi:1-aminocyclopropane-1-carboxylate deaminase/D-cysteine desulfhydrase-like pyridoxal-dependent ACC family enzyme